MFKTKGVILAGGKGTRLLPATKIYNKHLVPILNKPMVLYPLETLRSFGVKDILIVTGGDYIGKFAEFLGDGSEYGVNLTYKVQKEAGGIAEALGLAENFANGGSVLVCLGDNIFGDIAEVNFNTDEAFLFLKETKENKRFGVPVFDSNGKIVKIEEKPKYPKSELAITGLYYYPNDVFKVIKTLKPSLRGELEITAVNNFYIKEKRCSYIEFSAFWSDAGTVESLYGANKWAYKKLKQ